MQPARILDIGAYTNPIHSFMSHCPKEVTIIEPCGELSHAGDNPYFSGNIECGTSNQSTLLNVFPTSIKTFVGTSEATHYDVVLCIGCDAAHGPTWKELMLLPRPVTIILEASIAYAWNGQRGYAWNGQRGSYPTEDELSDGCILKYKQKFDFSNCTDCGFHGPMVAHTDYGKSHQLVVLECLDRPPNAERHQKASAALDCK